ncbi:hypothetical protein [Acidihalobacter ferrooxydans]|uniref:ATP-grasp domain-containing protein n=1 Tax=Acidihalobacter ferrooxydans TaxID=1765967 RepID=A0A1P8UI30_9GAMM|nr:hypothetical protein [Acidihalobacter ferrooxydans]APZ43486.1 hypothetical protein BW247_10615 [Acidihalobacter ferrooxydans]
MKAGRVPALVLGGGLNGLGIVRSLGAAGVPVYVAESRRDDPALSSRYARPLYLPALHGETLLAELERLGAERFSGNRPVLVLTQEQSVRTLGSAQERLQPFYRFLLPPSAPLDALMRKPDFSAMAAAAGLPAPATVRVCRGEDIEAALALRFPLVLKPAWHAPSYVRAGLAKAYRVDTPAAAHERIETMLRALPDVVVQEWVEGGDDAIYFCLQHLNTAGQSVASFVGRKLRSWPPRVGGTAACTSAPQAQALIERTARFFARHQVQGLAGMEYKQNEQGEYLAIEPTVGRSDYQEEVATLNGVNLPLAYYLDALGQGGEYRSGANRSVVWMDTESEQRAAQAQGRPAGRWPQAHGPMRSALWRARDPMPWLAQRARRLTARLGRS